MHQHLQMAHSLLQVGQLAPVLFLLCGQPALGSQPHGAFFHCSHLIASAFFAQHVARLPSAWLQIG